MQTSLVLCELAPKPNSWLFHPWQQELLQSSI